MVVTASIVDGDCGGEITSRGYNIESLGDNYADYQLEHQRYHAALKRCTIELTRAGRLMANEISTRLR